jgi:hypothetical protein
MNSTTGADSTALSMAALVSVDKRRRNCRAAGLEDARDHGLGSLIAVVAAMTARDGCYDVSVM